MPNNTRNVKCSFCGKPQDSVKKIIAGPGVYICDECINVCQEIIEDEFYEEDEEFEEVEEEKIRIWLYFLILWKRYSIK